MKKLLLVFVLALGLSVWGAFVLRGGNPFAAVMPSVVHLLTNDFRKEHKAGVLHVDDALTRAAQAKALDMAARGYFAHQDPDGRMAWYWMDKAGYAYAYAGENLAINFEDSKSLFDAWVGSPTHKDNILNPKFTDIGIGMATGTFMGKPAMFVVELFGSQAQN